MPKWQSAVTVPQDLPEGYDRHETKSIGRTGADEGVEDEYQQAEQYHGLIGPDEMITTRETHEVNQMTALLIRGSSCCTAESAGITF